MFPTSTFTYGYELELSNALRTREIPQHLGSWEYAERDIVNTLPPFQYVAADPLGQSPPYGGEINTKPTRTIDEQVANIGQLINMFREAGDPAECGPTSHGHVHIYVPGLKEDIAALKRLSDFVFRHQAAFINKCSMFVDHSDMDPAARRYFRWDGARLLPGYINENIQNLAHDFDSFISMHARGKDGVSVGRPFRYGINMYCMKHTGTIEFRMFRGTTNLEHIKNSFLAARAFLDCALNTGSDPMKEEAIAFGEFAPMHWNREAWLGLLRTKHGEHRGKKQRKFQEAV